MGAVLSQRIDWIVIAYASWSLDKGEQNKENYSSEKELEPLALVWAVSKQFREVKGYSMGVKSTVFIVNSRVAYINISHSTRTKMND